MYSAEHTAQPEHFKNAFSGVWWSVSALLTVGYGDIYPVTWLGKLLAIIISFLGVGAVAIPTGIISAGFVEQYTEAASKGKGDLEGVTSTLVVDISSSWIGKDTETVERDFRVVILLVKRGGQSEKPGQDYRVMVGDELVIYER